MFNFLTEQAKAQEERDPKTGDPPKGEEEEAVTKEETKMDGNKSGGEGESQPQAETAPTADEGPAEDSPNKKEEESKGK